MSWIKEISYEEAQGRLKNIYDRVKGPNGHIDNILTVHSLRPHTLHGHMSLYKNVLHNSNNTLPKWYLEFLGVYVSSINRCDYCIAHHFAGLQRLLGDEEKGKALFEAIQLEDFDDLLPENFCAGMAYAKALTMTPYSLSQEEFSQMRTSGLTDGEILEINQVVSYFCYVNRTVLGLGVTTEGDILGLNPNESSDPDNWNHS